MNKKFFSSKVLRTGAALCVAAGAFGFAPAPAAITPVCSAEAAAAELLPEIAEIRDLTLCAWATLVSRDDHAGQTARYTLKAMGYDLSGLKLDAPKGNAEFNVISAADETGAVKSKILVMGGTPTLSESANLDEPAPVFFEEAILLRKPPPPPPKEKSSSRRSTTALTCGSKPFSSPRTPTVRSSATSWRRS